MEGPHNIDELFLCLIEYEECVQHSTESSYRVSGSVPVNDMQCRPRPMSRFHFLVKKVVQCLETNEKSIIRFLRSLVFEIWLFLYSKRLNFFMSFEYKIHHNSKLKIAQGKLIFQTFQFIAHLPLKWEQN